MMKANVLYTLFVPAALLGSCIYVPQTMPQMPLRGTTAPSPTAASQKPQKSWVAQHAPFLQQQQQTHPRVKTPTPQPVQPVTTPVLPQPETTPVLPQPTSQLTTPKPVALPQPTTKVTTPQPKTTPKKEAVKPVIQPEPAPVKPVVTGDPKPVTTTVVKKEVPKPAAVTAVEQIPVARRVPGDPMRVYNPYDESNKILIKGADGKPFPSGKKLKIQGTDKFFIVP